VRTRKDWNGIGDRNR